MIPGDVMTVLRLVFALALFAGASGSVAASSVDDLLRSAEKALGTEVGKSSASKLTEAEIDSGLKEALGVGAERAIALLGQDGGYLDDPQVRIKLPGALRKAGKVLKQIGYESLVDDFETATNRAAEQAIPATLAIVKQTVTEMTLEDVRGILSGGDDAATQFLRSKAGERLHAAVLPIVSTATDQAGATAAYKKLADQAARSSGGLVTAESIDLDDYVADKTLDGLFVKLAAEEKAIRENPAARSTDLLKKVFGGG
jgi:hypothetical protein